MKPIVYFPEECKELHVSSINSLPEEVMNATHTVSNKDLVDCGKVTWVNGYAQGFIRGVFTVLIPVAGIGVVCLIKRHFSKKKKEGK